MESQTVQQSLATIELRLAHISDTLDMLQLGLQKIIVVEPRKKRWWQKSKTA